MIKNKVVKNASWIIGCNIVKSIFSLVISMLTARYLGPSNFGVINYAASIVAFVAPIMYLGLNSILVQEIVSNPDEDNKILGTAITLSFISSLFCILGIFAFTSIVNFGETETIIVSVLYSILLIFQGIDLIQYWFQANYLSKYPSIVILVAYAIVSVYKIFLLVTKKGIYWFAVSNAIDYMIIAFSLVIIFKILSKKKFNFSCSLAKKLLSKSKYYILSSMMVTIFAQTDKIMIKLMIGDAETGFYSAGVTCAGMTGFIFSAIIDSFRPLIFEMKKKDNEKYLKSLYMLNSIVIYLSLLQSIFITLFSKYIILILYGKDYLESVNALRIIVWYTTFSYLGATRNIWLLAEGKQKYLTIIDSCGALFNVILNFILIPFLGICGAALASLLTQIFTNIIISFFIKPIRYNNTILFRSLNLKFLIKKYDGQNKKQ